MKLSIKLIFIFICLLTFNLQAQNTTREEVSNFAKKINAGSQIKFIFTLFNTDNTVSTVIEGEAKIYNNKYLLLLDNDCELYSNGINTWLYNPDTEEVMISSNKAKGGNILENPFSILTQSDSKYKIQFIKGTNSTYPKEIICGGEQKISIKIQSFNTLKDINESIFTYNPAKHPGVTVNDLR